MEWQQKHTTDKNNIHIKCESNIIIENSHTSLIRLPIQTMTLPPQQRLASLPGGLSRGGNTNRLSLTARRNNINSKQEFVQMLSTTTHQFTSTSSSAVTCSGDRNSNNLLMIAPKITTTTTTTTKNYEINRKIKIENEDNIGMDEQRKINILDGTTDDRSKISTENFCKRRKIQCLNDHENDKKVFK